MGGFSDQPYIYEPQNRRIAFPYSDFNPKAVTQASYRKLREDQSPSDHTPKKDGAPLINFNEHPDSYMIVAGQNVNYEPMSPNTKKKVTILRWIQFALRILELIGALGMLVCVICVKGMVTSMAWITRIAPAWDAVITIYAIYHLARSPKARPPLSSASYHMFAIFMDVGLIPFYVFIAIFANNNYFMDVKEETRWTTFFTAEGATNLVLYVAFVGSIVVAGLHAVSTFFDLWLVILFRKIGKLPPDLNPLEENLTSRKASKHKYKNSEVTLTGSVNEKSSHFSSGSTASVNDQSHPSTVINHVPGSRQVPFRHSRTGSELGYSPHNPNSARWSRQNLDEDGMYQQSHSARGSMASVRPHTRGESMSPLKTASFAITELPPTPTRSPRPTSYPNGQTPGGAYPSNRFSAPVHPNAALSNALVKAQQHNVLLGHGNWSALDDEDENADLGTPNRPRANYADRGHIERHDSFEPQPLKMHPPTPPPPSSGARHHRNALAARSDNGNGNSNVDLSRHLTMTSNATGSSSVYSDTAPSLHSSSSTPSNGNGTPKSKYYGDLAAATRGIRHNGVSNHGSNETLRAAGTMEAPGYEVARIPAKGGYARIPDPPPSPSKTKTPKVFQTSRAISNETAKSSATLDASGYDATGMSSLGSYGFCPSPPPKVPKLNRDRNGRVVSRSGIDLVNASQSMVDAAQSRRREVSGKVVEEGRGGRWKRF